MNVSTERGQLKVKAIYAESSKVSSSSGEIQLGHIHGMCSWTVGQNELAMICVFSCLNCSVPLF